MKASTLRPILLSLTLNFGNTTNANPTDGQPSCHSTEFRQDFLVGNGREFTQEELQLFETVYQGLTPKFSPDPDPNTKVTSTCMVTRQVLLEEEAPSQNNRLVLTYTMKYESSHYNVTKDPYPKLFMNWTWYNTVVVLLKLQMASLDVTEVRGPRRLLILKPCEFLCCPTSFTASPTLSPTTTLLPTTPTTTPEPTSLPSDGSKPYSWYLSVALPVTLVLMVAGAP